MSDASKPRAPTKSRRQLSHPPLLYKRPLTFDAILRDAEQRLARGHKLDFNQIMSNIDALMANRKKFNPKKPT